MSKQTAQKTAPRRVANAELAARNAELHRRWKEANQAHEAAIASGDPDAVAEALRAERSAANALLEPNVGLAAAIARKYVMNGNYDEMMSAAMMGLWEAIRSWDPSRATLGVAARRHIEGRIRRVVCATEARSQGITYTTWQQQPRVVAAARALAAEELPVTPQAVAQRAKVSVSVAEQLLRRAPVSLSTPVGDEDGSTLEDFVSEKAHDHDQDFSAELSDAFVASVTRLHGEGKVGPAEVLLYALRHGLHGDAPLPVTDAAAVLHVGRGQARNMLERMDTLLRTDSKAGLPHVVDRPAQPPTLAEDVAQDGEGSDDAGPDETDRNQLHIM